MKLIFEYRTKFINNQTYPVLGIFLSPDIAVQSPENSQSYNRYSYCMNNPLMYNDPSGYSWLSHFTGWVGERLSSVDPTMNGTITNKGIAAFIKIGSWGPTFVPSTFDFLGHGCDFSKYDPFLKGSISNNSARITMGLFTGTHQQILSRLTWELPQSVLGFTVTQGSNYMGKVKNVDYFYGATLVNQYGNSDIYGMTMGNYILGMGLQTSINANSTVIEKEGFYTFVHEYGHYIESQKSGFAYLWKYAVPSLQNQIFDPDYHSRYGVEVDASTRGLDFFSNESITQQTGFNRSEYLNGVSGFVGTNYYSYPGTPIGKTLNANVLDYLGLGLVTFFNW